MCVWGGGGGLSNAEEGGGGHKKFPPFKKRGGGGALKVLPCLEGDAKSFGPVRISDICNGLNSMRFGKNWAISMHYKKSCRAVNRVCRNSIDDQ